MVHAGAATMSGPAMVAVLLVLLGVLVLGLVLRTHRVRSLARALAALGGRVVVPPPLPPVLQWAGSEVTAARAFDVLPGVPGIIVTVMRSPLPAVAADLGTTKADPFVAIYVPTRAIGDGEVFHRMLAAQVALEEIAAAAATASTHQIVVVRAAHSGRAVAAAVAAVRQALAASRSTKCDVAAAECSKP